MFRSGAYSFGEQHQGARHGVVRGTLPALHLRWYRPAPNPGGGMQRVACSRITFEPAAVNIIRLLLPSACCRRKPDYGAALVESTGPRGVKRGLRELLDNQSHGLCKVCRTKNAAGRNRGLVSSDGVMSFGLSRQMLYMLYYAVS